MAQVEARASASESEDCRRTAARAAAAKAAMSREAAERSLRAKLSLQRAYDAATKPHRRGDDHGAATQAHGRPRAPSHNPGVQAAAQRAKQEEAAAQRAAAETAAAEEALVDAAEVVVAERRRLWEAAQRVEASRVEAELEHPQPLTLGVRADMRDPSCRYHLQSGCYSLNVPA